MKNTFKRDKQKMLILVIMTFLHGKANINWPSWVVPRLPNKSKMALSGKNEFRKILITPYVTTNIEAYGKQL